MSSDLGWPFPPSNKVPLKWIRKSKAVVAACGIFAKICAEWMNNIQVYNKEVLHAAVGDRPKDQPLITVSNHRSCIDDPVLWGVLKWSHLVSNNEVMRWTLGASDIVFTKRWHCQFFSLGRVVPVVRGGGVYQKGMDFVLDKLNKGEWVHTFPEGGIVMNNEDKRLKWGVGRLIAECIKLPLVLPMWHVGMDSIMPNTKPYIPRAGKKATLLVGEPIDLKDLLSELRELKKTPREMRKAITDVIQEEFRVLRQKAESLHYAETLKHS